MVWYILGHAGCLSSPAVSPNSTGGKAQDGWLLMLQNPRAPLQHLPAAFSKCLDVLCSGAPNSPT